MIRKLTDAVFVMAIVFVFILFGLVFRLSAQSNTIELEGIATGVRTHSCGVERQAVKTLHDPGAKAIPFKPSDATIEELVAMPAPDRKHLMAATATRFPEEHKVYRVHALLIGYKAESDEDFHVVIASPKDSTVTMIVELPSDDCMPGRNSGFLRKSLESKFGKATAKFRKLKSPATVTVTGYFFFDFIHGQTGVAPNGAELHPVLQLTF